MKKVNFIMGLHCHQPVGNFDWVFEDAYKRAYLPFIETIEKYPSLKFVFHYSGCLLEWLEERKPEFFGPAADQLVAIDYRELAIDEFEPDRQDVEGADGTGDVRAYVADVHADRGGHGRQGHPLFRAGY